MTYGLCYTNAKEIGVMKSQKYEVKLTNEERNELLKFVKSKSKKVNEQCRTRAKVILHLDLNGSEPLTPERIAEKCKIHRENVYLIRKEFFLRGIGRITFRKKRETPPVEPKVTGDVEAYIIATACGSPPEGKSRWSLQMLADKVVLDGHVKSISDVTIMRTLKKRNLSLT
jgi:hypothetical protein